MTATRTGDLYEILGVDKGADERTIKSAYRRLAKKYHPDTNPGDAEAERRFKEVNAAWQILSDPKRRRLYDKYGPVSLEEGFDEALYNNRDRGHTHLHFEGVDDDILSEIFGGMFGGPFGNRSHHFTWEDDWVDDRGSDLEMTVEIPFTTAALGGEVKVHAPGGPLMCRIPAGIRDGTRLRLRGKGSAGHGTRGKGSNGDLYLLIRIAVPKRLSEEARRKLKELEKLL